MPAVDSKYDLQELKDGFILKGRDRVPVTVKLCDTGFRVRIHRFRQQSLFSAAEFGETNFSQTPATNLVQYRRLLDLVVHGVMLEWQPSRSRSAPHRIRSWALTQTRQALGRRIHQQWVRLILKADPNVLGVQKSVFAATFRSTPLLHQRSLYEDAFLVQDILNYRAAAALVPVADALCNGHPLERCCEELNPEFDAQGWARGEQVSLQHPAEKTIAALSKWQELCSQTGKRYRSLSRTLMNFPGGIPCDLLFFFPTLQLIRPVTHRLELLALLLTAGELHEKVSQRASILKIIQQSHRLEIRDGMQRVSEKFESPLTHRRTWDVGQFIAFLLTNPEPYHGRLSGLVSRAIRWYESQENAPPLQASVPIRGLDRSVRTRIPPTGIPCIDGVRFLETIGDIIDEGNTMQHCVSAYIGRAVEGTSYIFHIEHRSEHATVELDSRGQLRQAFGPMNCKNAATDYAARVFKEYCESQKKLDTF
ncbi:PcfJ domain-containing protein [Thalassoglobus sp.]|uniref:PcfJ domain-containing protein n=1 Tax=Thalassoglobus sp. TaxID=2795869 RepID=UPI003AA7E8C7